MGVYWASRWWLTGLLTWGLALAAGPAGGQQPADTLRHAEWHLYRGYEFDQPGDSSRLASAWRFAYPWGRTLGGFEDEYYLGQQVGTDSAGVLHLLARRRRTPRRLAPALPGPRRNYDSGMIFSRTDGEQAGDFTYGLFEMRCRVPRTRHAFAAFWLFGDPDEVDVFETGLPDLITNNVIHHSHAFWRPGPAEASQSSYYWPGAGHLTDEFHTFALSWQPQELVYYFDGVPIRHETRLLPLGRPLQLIANLAMYAWSAAPADSFDIDFIRVFRPRLPPPALPVQPPPPAAGLLRGPRTSAAVLGAGRSGQVWAVDERPGRRPQLCLRQNRDPADFNTLPLPRAGRWLAPLLSADYPLATQHWLAALPGPAPPASHWTLYDLMGSAVRSEQRPAALPCALAWPGLPPGAYWLRLQQGSQVVWQAVYQVGRPQPAAPSLPAAPAAR